MNDDNEPVGALEGTPEIERVFLGEEVKLVRATAIVLFRDTLEALLEVHAHHGATFSFESPAPVTGLGSDPHDTPIGSAALSWEGDHVVAALTLAYDCPERLMLQTDQPLYAESIFRANADTNTVVFAGLFLTTHRPTDERETRLVLIGE